MVLLQNTRREKVVEVSDSRMAVLVFTDIQTTDVFTDFWDFYHEAEKQGLKRTFQTWLMKKKILFEEETINSKHRIGRGTWGNHSYEIYVRGGKALVKIADKGTIEYDLGSLVYDAVHTLEEEAEG